MSLVTAFASSVQQDAGKPALFWGDQEFSYGGLWRQALAVTTHLQGELQVKTGDRVGIWLKNCPEFVPALFGILQAGAVVVPINNFLKPEEVGYILEDAGVKVLISESSMGEALAKLAASRPQLQLLRIDEFGARSFPAAEHGKSQIADFKTAFERLPSNRRVERDLAVIIYTSGTTGRPKGAMLSHSNLLHNVESCRQILSIVEHDRFAVILPLFHSFMLTVGMLLPLLTGGAIVLVKSLHPPRNLLQEIIQRKASILPAIPQFFRSLISAPITGKDLPVRLFISGAAPLPVQVLTEFRRKFEAPLLEGYGLSEASPVVTTNPPRGIVKAGSIGIPIPDVEVTIQNEAGATLPPGEVGELCVRGGNVMQGYWNQPEETARTLRDGWLLTGDIGYRDADGYFYITDRKKDMLLVNGINVYPREVEEVLYQFPGVREAAVIGVPDARKGEQPLAFVAAEDGLHVEERALLQFVRDKLADYKVPKRVLFLPALPRNATGKILKTALRQQAAAAH